MRHFFTWILVFGVLAGLGSRVLAAGDAHPTCAHEHHDCQGEGSAPAGHPQDRHDDKCPADHHHHCGACLHGVPLGVENEVIHRIAAPWSSRLALRHESESPPEGPSRALDKPPLI